MGFLKGLGKVAFGIMESGKIGIMSDGGTTFCSKCGMPTHGPCKSCASKNAPRLISEGIKDIKTVDEKIYIEAEKRGYIKASEEYGDAFEKIQTEYIEAKQRFEKIIREKDIYSEQLISQHEQLVIVRKSLELEFEQKIKQVAEKNNVYVETVRNAASGNVFGLNKDSDLFAMLHSYKDKKIREAECKGYNRAKREYEKKINALKCEFEELMSVSNQKIEELHGLISDVLNAISDERMKIATLEVMK